MNRFTLLAVIVCLAIGAGCKTNTSHTQAMPTPVVVVEKGDPITALASLTAPEKLATLNLKPVP